MGHTSYDVSGLSPALLTRLDADPYWRNYDRRDVGAAACFEHVADVALRIASRMPQPLSVVCGPIRSGGLGNATLNLEHFSHIIRELRNHEWSVFNQLPFERHLWRIEKLPGKKSFDILEVFYGQLFRSGFIKQLVFQPRWRSSLGTSWEHARAVELGIPIMYLLDQRILWPSS